MKIKFQLCGQTPPEEPGAVLGLDPLYAENANQHCQAFKRMLARKFPIPINTFVMFLLKGTPTEQGTRLDIYLAFNNDDNVATRYTHNVRRNMPKSWDRIAYDELIWYREKARLLERIALGELHLNEIPDEFRGVRPPQGITSICDSRSLVSHEWQQGWSPLAKKHARSDERTLSNNLLYAIFQGKSPTSPL
jgi:hypothetical protein